MTRKRARDQLEPSKATRRRTAAPTPSNDGEVGVQKPKKKSGKGGGPNTSKAGKGSGAKGKPTRSKKATDAPQDDDDAEQKAPRKQRNGFLETPYTQHVRQAQRQLTTIAYV